MPESQKSHQQHHPSLQHSSRFTPILVVFKPLVHMTVNVVPKLVEQSAASAAKACSAVALVNTINRYDRPIGRAIPVKATIDESQTFATKLFADACKPPDSRSARFVIAL